MYVQLPVHTKEFIMRIKVKLEPHPRLLELVSEIRDWENEGGQISDYPLDRLSIASPLKPGDLLEVTSGHVIDDNGIFYYEANIRYID